MEKIEDNVKVEEIEEKIIDEEDINLEEDAKFETVEKRYLRTKEDRYNINLRQRMEEKNSGEIITMLELSRCGYGNLVNWIDKTISRYGKIDDRTIIFKYENRIKMWIYTDSYCYSISSRLPNNDKGYLGCTASTRKNKVGEYWNRGNDLPDGDYSIETWYKILGGIVSYELKEIECWR